MSIFLETTRLTLKTLNRSHFKNLIVLRTDPDVMKYSFNVGIQTAEQEKQFLEIALKYQEKYGYGYFTVFEKATGHLVGQAGLFHLSFIEEQSEIEVAYRLHKQFWGQGYATELVRALIQWGFENLQLTRLIALVNLENIASCRVLDKAGMTYTGTVKRFDEILPCYEIYKKDHML